MHTSSKAKRLRRAVAACLTLVLFTGNVAAAGLPAVISSAAAAPLNPANLQFVQVATGFSSPVGITHAGDGSGRLFIIERAGRIRILNKTGMLSTSFLDVTSIVQSSGGEEGLLALAFHPNYESNRYFYTVHVNSGGNIVLSRFTTSASDPNQAPASSRVELLVIPHPGQANHNGGTLAFGQDGYLYWSTGDGGGGGDPSDNAQNLNSLLGKILRLDVDSGSPYAIPPDNPFVGIAGADEIWAYGLRNPWRMSFDRLTYDLYIGDVGQGSREEIDFQPASSTGGENYGWRVMEGSLCYNASSCDQSQKVLPVTEYTHSGGNCSVTGGYVYRGPDYPSMQGHYLYADFCTGQFHDLYNDAGSWTDTLLVGSPYLVSTFGEDEEGELYFTSYGDGSIHQVRYQVIDSGAPPDNDDVASPRLVTDIPFEDSLDATGATSAAGDSTIGACNLRAGRRSVWFSFAPSVDREVNFDTFDSNYDTFLAIWSGSPGSLTPVACNDDDARSRLQSAVGFDAVAGTTYYIEIGEWTGFQTGPAGFSSMPDPDGEVDLTKELVLHATTFQDVAGTALHWLYIEALWNAGFTAGCSTDPLRYCPDLVLDRAQTAVFLLRGEFGAGYLPPNPPPTINFADNWTSDVAYAQKWAEALYAAGFTAGCQNSPQLLYCPGSLLPRVEASVFGVRMMPEYGANYVASNTPTTGTVFADMTDPNYFGTKWAELAYAEGLLPDCGTAPGGQPNFCPDDLVNRAWGAYLIARAKDLTLPTP